MKRSAGLLVWRRGAEGVEVLLAHPGGPLFAGKDDGHWSIPKGEYDADKPALAAANREFAEEIGVAPPPGDPVPLGDSRQSSGKVNTIWAVEGDLDVTEVSSNLFPMEWPPRSGRIQEFPEIDRADWFSLPAARVKLFASQQVFLDRLEQTVVGSQP
ncbi:putative NUDIX family NTP pyrophosphohydrolase [Motilibacter rhizosphaerae]|uniref:Putative NUDIX family NTP pyrophosphohydrolase n=1 Tax=Motilibacter rhizosphaerae TaxID=598652 RepID=A0A4Q7NNK9_9ACTN|nr:NUDIX domain-containing protein [Motilibacter rhizosphaerae]RZS86819.1 putative NUDIX family NTP pyrophosphohydrolase [Motilibacter rhizosphaerae]